MNYLYVSKLIKELDDLQGELDDLEYQLELAKEAVDEAAESEVTEDDSDESELDRAHADLDVANDDIETWHGDNPRYEKLKQLKSDLGDNWDNSTTLIPEQDFKEYAMNYASEIQSFDDNAWPFTCIDWKQAADDLATDYQRVDFDGEEYLYSDY
jgi:hypothetical protein